MKKLLALFMLSALILSSCGEKTKEEKIEEMEDDAQTFEDGEADDVTSFNDGLVGLQGRVLKIFIEMDKTEEPDELMKLADEGVAECDDILDILDKNSPYSGGEKMQSALVVCIQHYKEYLAKTKRLFEIEQKEEYTEEEEAEYNELYETLYDGVGEAEDAFIAAQGEFARKNGMQITDNPLDDELE